MLTACCHAEAAFRCDGQIIETGDSRLRVRSLCGEPDLVDAAGHYYLGHVASADSETWYYNFGPRQLIRVLRFRRGSLVEIDQDGYGFRDTGNGSCDSFDVVEGLSKFRLIASCGLPDDTEIARVLRPVDHHDYRGFGAHLKGHRIEVVRERWIYNFGPDQLLRIAWIENGRVVDVEVGERGYRNR
ncbi:DUF2845 domain-containing protein [uncultured Abyssibacter sp.]|uniref:DUF2845 domain-containing protein n=1 Tax=uncultured Abyssibacter sp. TaxID=2320202 RepID=UPI0032B241A4